MSTRLPLLLCFSLVVGLVAGIPGVTAGQTDRAAAAATAPDFGMEVTRTYHLTPDEPGSIRITLDYAVGKDSRAIGVGVPEKVTVEEKIGFERDDNGNLIATSNQEPRLTLSVPVNETNSRFGGSDFVDVGDWAFVSAYTVNGYWSEVTGQWEYEGSSSRVSVDNTVAGEGYAGSRWAYLGPYERETTLVNGQTFNVIVPDESATDTAAQQPMDVLEPTAEDFAVGARPSQVNVFVVPEPLRQGGRTSHLRLDGQQDLWVSESNPGSSVLIHEYIHTRQDFRTTNRTRWLVEGSAEYYETVYGVRTGAVEYAELERSFADRTYEDGVLADNESWEGTGLTVDYDKGSRVIAALDDRIRTETDGERTFMAVMAKLNEHDGPITLDVFKEIVASVAGTSLDSWIDRYVTTAAAPTYPDDPEPSYYLPAEDLPVEEATADERDTTTDAERTDAVTADPATATADSSSGESGPGFTPITALLAVLVSLGALAGRRLLTGRA